jgi:signal transduction histidine kinase/ligand-binding sensor domain-containing protein
LNWPRVTIAGTLGCWLTCVLLMAGSVHALDPNKRLTQYMHTSWRIQDGSAPSGMWSIAQTSDGFLWLSSIPGDLYRFDGVRFARSRSTDHGSIRNLNLFGDHAGGLWGLGTHEVVHLQGGIVTSRFPLEGRSELQGISEDPDGSLWVVRSGTNVDAPLCHVTARGLKCFGKSDGIPISPIDSLLADGKGGFWLGGQTTLVHWHEGVSQVYPIHALRTNSGQHGIASMARGPDGTLWVGILAEGRGLGLGRLIEGTVKPFMTPTFDGSKVEVSRMVFDRDGSLWVGTAGKGVFRIHENQVDHFERKEGLSGDTVWAILEDQEGIVWAVTTDGVDSFRDPRVITVSASEGLGKDGAAGVLASRDGTVWVANDGSLDHIEKNGSITSIRAGGGLPGHQVTSLLEDRAGRMWVGVDNELYLFTKGRFRALPQKNHEPLGMVVGLTEDTDGNIWAECLSNPRKLVRILDFKIRDKFPVPQFPAGRTLAKDPHGGIWIGALDGSVTLFRNGRADTAFALDSGGDPRRHRIVAQADGSVLVGSENGLVGWRQGKWQRLTTKNGLPCDQILSFIEDKEERWWLYTDCGVVELPDSELQKWWTQPEAVVQTRLYDALDGAQPNTSFFNSAAYSADDRVWFVNGFVLQMVEASRRPQKALLAATYIESVTVDRKEIPVTENIKLSPRPRDVQIDYTSPTFLIPQRVKFRYRLDGYDRDWHDAGTRRQAFYMDLPPGRFSFHVIACNSDGIWNENAATLDFSIAPSYYQTNWFRALCGALFLALLWVAYQLRVGQLRQQFGMTLEARVSERTRIARELHDTLLQGAHGLLLRFATVSQLLPERPMLAKEKLDSAIQQTADFVTEARDEVQGLRDSTVHSNDLAMAISTLGEELVTELANQRPPTLHVAVEGKAQNLHPIIRDEIYKISAEALRNAFRHSQARRLEVDIRYDNEQFRLRVRDDGKGIDPAILSSQGSEGHYGLRGMRERAALIGGKLAVWSKVDGGTEVELRLPAAAAYGTAQRRWWFSPKPKA